MALKIKMRKIGIIDVVKFATLGKQRERIIKKTVAKDIVSTFAINETAKKLHPDSQLMIVEDIIDHGDAGAKTIILKKKDNSPAAYFKAGQYISVLLNINGSVVTRPYSISSSPKWTKDGKIAITVKENNEHFAAEYILSRFKINDEITVSAPEGNFFYDEIRDSKNVVAVAGGSGITPFLSMAYAIRDGIEDFNLTILFGSKNEASVLFKDELNKISADCDKVKVVHILSDEKKDGFEYGFITSDIIKKYAPEDYSLFMCGPEALYRFADGEIKKLGLPKRKVRKELLGVTKKVWEKEDYPKECKDKEYTFKVIIGPEEYTVAASANDTVLASVEKAGINAPSRCRSGECGWCRSKLVSGKVYIPEENDGRRYADKENNYIHPCACFPLSDLVIEVPGSYLK